MNRLPGLVFVCCLSFCANAERISDIRNTSHNFAVTSSNPVSATEENQICVFCHTPHMAESIPNGPLWNRSLSGSVYTPYTSSSINALDIAATPGGSSKLCLSCHDGTIAIGAVNVLEGRADVTISMQGTGPGGVISSGSGSGSGFTRRLGVDLTNDHPISFTYDAALALADNELRNPLIESHIGNRGGGIYPIVPLENQQVQCTSCHDPHIRDSNQSKPIKFLRLNRFQEGPPTGGAFREADDIICLACHDKLAQTWSSSVHASVLDADEIYSTTAATVREFPLNTAVWQASCLNCHDTHTVQGARRLLREGTDSLTTPKNGGNSATEETCYQCHSNDGNVLLGQGGPSFSVPDIKTEFETNLIHMPIKTADQGSLDEAHNATDADLMEPVSQLSNLNRHAECTDCHNPHRVVKNRLFNNLGTGVAATHRHDTGHSNVASGSLRGTWGVEPVYGTSQFDPTNFPITYLVKKGDGGNSASVAKISGHVTREYQICFKCHSDYSYGSVPPFLGDTGGSTASGTNGVVRYTNQAIEFQAPFSHQGETTATDSGAHSSFTTNNHRSWHPVLESTGRTVAIRRAGSENWLAPWDSAASIGNQTMYCSDCHGSNTAPGTVVPTGGEDGSAWGPHGSNNSFMLKGGWSSNTGTGSANGLCFKCHDHDIYATEAAGDSGFGGPEDPNLHSFHAKKIGHMRCTWCHTAIPHGWKNKGFLVNLNDVGPEVGLPPGTQVRNNTTAGYTNGPYYLNAMLKVRNFRSSGSWREQDCGSSGSPGNGENGRDWMRDSSENCENPP